MYPPLELLKFITIFAFFFSYVTFFPSLNRFAYISCTKKKSTFKYASIKIHIVLCHVEIPIEWKTPALSTLPSFETALMGNCLKLRSQMNNQSRISNEIHQLNQIMNYFMKTAYIRTAKTIIKLRAPKTIIKLRKVSTCEHVKWVWPAIHAHHHLSSTIFAVILFYENNDQYLNIFHSELSSIIALKLPILTLQMLTLCAQFKSSFKLQIRKRFSAIIQV